MIGFGAARIGIGLLFHGVVQDQNGLVGLDGSQARLDYAPQVFLDPFRLRQEPSDRIVTQRRNQRGKTRGGGRTEGGEKVIRVQVEHLGIAR